MGLVSHHLELRNRDGSLMAFVSTGLPSHIRSLLEVNLLAAFENADLLGETNTRVPGAGGRPFQAMHLSWYNRHCTSVSWVVPTSINYLTLITIYQGHDAPTEVQPWLLEKEGMRTNHGQVIPYISRDLQQHRRIYDTISRVYAELFEWVRGLVSTSESECFRKAYIICVRWRITYKKSLRC
jgi:hypothetical protein